MINNDSENTKDHRATQERPTSISDFAQLYTGQRHWFIFPAPPNGKLSYLSEDDNGNRWGATNDPEIAKQYFKTYRRAGIGIACVESGIFVVEADTVEGHGVDGLASMRQLEDDNGVLPTTLKARSPSGSEHYYFKYPVDLDGKIITRALDKHRYPGIDVKGHGGMVIAPPTVRSDGVYEWINDNEIADAPQWLLDMVVERVVERPPVNRSPGTIGPNAVLVPGLLDEIDPNDLDRSERFQVGCAVFAEVGEQGREVFQQWRSRGSKYDAHEASRRWNDIVDRSHGYNCSYTTLERIHDKVTETDEVRAAMLMVQRNVDKIISNAKQRSQPTGSMVVVNASDIVAKPKDWIWNGHLLRGSQELMTGLPGVGKSQTQISFIASITTGSPFPDGSRAPAPANVIMLTAEDNLSDEVIPRLKAAGADLTRVKIIKGIKVVKSKNERQFLLTQDLDSLERKVEEIGDVVLITIDPITAYMGGKVDSHKATEVRSQLGPLKDFAERTNVAVSTVTHPAKAAGGKALDQFIGSQAFIAAGRIGHVCVPEFTEIEDEEDGDDGNGKKRKVPTGRILFTHAKHNASRKHPTYAFQIEEILISTDPYITAARIVWDKDPVDITADEAVSDAAGIVRADQRRQQQNEVQLFLKIMLRNGRVAQKEIEAEAQKHGFSLQQLNRAKTKLGIVPTKDGFSGGWFWQLPWRSSK